MQIASLLRGLARRVPSRRGGVRAGASCRRFAPVRVVGEGRAFIRRASVETREVAMQDRETVCAGSETQAALTIEVRVLIILVRC